MTANTRIYRITVGDKSRLVRAAHPANALMFVARDMAKVSVATQDELVKLVAGGVRVEDAGNAETAPTS